MPSTKELATTHRRELFRLSRAKIGDCYQNCYFFVPRPGLHSRGYYDRSRDRSPFANLSQRLTRGTALPRVVAGGNIPPSDRIPEEPQWINHWNRLKGLSKSDGRREAPDSTPHTTCPLCRRTCRNLGAWQEARECRSALFPRTWDERSGQNAPQMPGSRERRSPP